MSRRKKVWRFVGAACLVAAVCVTIVWWPYMKGRMSDWSSDDPPAKTAVRATVLGLTLAGAFILAGASKRRGEK